MKITGELLKSERLKKDLSAQDVASALKLSVRIINAIESGQTDELPAKTFVRGFVKSYAEYLKIESEPILKQFHEEMGATQPVPKYAENVSSVYSNPSVSGTNFKTKTATHGESQVSQSQNTKSYFNQNADPLPTKSLNGSLSQNNLLYFVAVTGLIFVIIFVNKITSHYKSEIPQEKNQNLTQQDQSQPQNQASATLTSSDLASATESAESLNATGSVPVSLPTQGDALASPETVDSSEVASASALATSTTVTTSSTTTTTSETVKIVTPLEKSKEQFVEVLIEVKKDSQIEYAKGNTTEFKSLLLRANTYHIIKSNSGLHLRANDGSAVNLTVNGINKGLLSNSKKAAEITF